MLPVEILPVQETIVLRARGSELLIMPQHVKKLKDLAKPRDFSQYFRDEALVNRPARKLFEAWLRKDHTLWARLYQMVHKEMELTGGGDVAESGAAQAAKSASKTPAKSAGKSTGAEETKATKKTAVSSPDDEAAVAKPAASAKAKTEKPAIAAAAKKDKPAAKAAKPEATAKPEKEKKASKAEAKPAPKAKDKPKEKDKDKPKAAPKSGAKKKG